MSNVKRFKASDLHVACCGDTIVVNAEDFDARDHAADVYFGSWKRTEQELDAQRLRADTAEAELKVIKQSIASLRNERAADDRKFECLGEILALLKDHPIVKSHQIHIDAALNPNPEAESHESN